MSINNEFPKQLPRIEVDYMFDNDELAYAPQFEKAADLYAEKVSEEEAFTLEKRSGDSYILMIFGKSVVRAASYADLGHLTDVMQADIERLAGMAPAEALLKQLRAGQAMYGSLPDPE